MADPPSEQERIDHVHRIVTATVERAGLRLVVLGAELNDTTTSEASDVETDLTPAPPPAATDHTASGDAATQGDDTSADADPDGDAS